MGDFEQPLPGNVTAGIVRVGDTVRRPVGPWTDTVDALLHHLHQVGFGGAPRPLGRDEQGRQVLEYVAGDLGDETGTYTVAELTTIGALLADFHNAVANFMPPPSAVWNRVITPDTEEIICHNDAAPWNLVRSSRGWVLIDWDAAGPGSRSWELAYAAQAMTGMRADREPHEAASRLRAFVDGYGLDEAARLRLAAMLGRRAEAMHDLLRVGAQEKRQPWARIWTEDGPYWRSTADYLNKYVDLWTQALL